MLGTRYPRARLSPAKKELVAVAFARRHIERGNKEDIRLDIQSKVWNGLDLARRPRDVWKALGVPVSEFWAELDRRLDLCE